MPRQPGTIRLLPLLALAAGIAAFVAPAGAAAADGDAPPSVLMIALDTWRADHLGAAGNDWIETPNADALAGAGVLYANCRSTAPWTRPSFASIFTGLLPYHHGLIGGRYKGLAAEQVTLAERLRDAGYATAAYVTIEFLGSYYGLAQGFEELEVHPDQHHGEEARIVTARAREFLAAHVDRPFFLLVHYFDIHQPYTPPAPFDRMYYEGDERAPGKPIKEFLQSEANRARPNNKQFLYDWLEGVTDLDYPARQYAACVSYVDDQVGQVLAALAELGLDDRTLVLLVADHGEHLGEHDIWFTHFLPYDETIHVPLVVRYPDGRGAGRVLQAPVSNLDLLPTVLQEVGLPLPDGLDGRPLPLADPPPGSPPRTIVAEQGHSQRQYSKVILEWPYKLLVLRAGDEGAGELYDLAADPGEEHNVILERPEARKRLLRRLWGTFDRDQMLTKQKAESAPTDEALQRRLRALGYVD